MIFPRRISDPPCAAVFAVGSRPDGKALARGIAALRERGFEVLNCVSKRGTEYGDEDRIRSLAKALKYPHCNLMIAARGGYGALRIIDQLDYQQIARARKIIVGFSDMTALSLAIFRKCRLVTFAGPMVLDHFADGVSAFTMDSFLNHIRGDHGKGTRFDLADWGV